MIIWIRFLIQGKQAMCETALLIKIATILQSNALVSNQMLIFLVSSCFVKGKSDALTTL